MIIAYVSPADRRGLGCQARFPQMRAIRDALVARAILSPYASVGGVGCERRSGGGAQKAARAGHAASEAVL